MGKNIIVTTDIVETAIERVASGRSLTAVANELGFNRQSLYAAIKRNPKALERYDEARKEAADSIAEEIIEIADTEPDAQRARVRTDVRRWLVSKLLPARYGEKLELEINQRVDIKSVMDEARKRVYGGSVIDAEVVKKEEPQDPVLPDIFK